MPRRGRRWRSRAGLAAEVERAEKGRCPKTIDPLSGKPFVRKAERLESVGLPNARGSLEDAHVWTFRRP